MEQKKPVPDSRDYFGNDVLSGMLHSGSQPPDPMSGELPTILVEAISPQE